MHDVFKKCLEFTLKWEGGYVNDPNDPGGRTIYGISEKAHPEVWAKGVPTKEIAETIYKEKYWEKIKGGLLPPKLALSMFDCAVNVGCSRAVRILQQILNVEQDGILGNITLGKIKQDYLIEYNEARKQFYKRLITKFPRLKRYENGWNNRVNSLVTYGQSTDFNTPD